MKFVFLKVIALLVFAVGFAAQATDSKFSLQVVDHATRFSRFQQTLENFCEITPRDFDCQVQVIRVNSFVPGALAWDQAIRQALKTESVHSFVSGKVLKNQVDVTEAFKDVAVAAGIDRSTLPFLNAWENLLLALHKDVFGQNVTQVYSGLLSGPLSLEHEFVVFVDRQNQELIVLRAGYSQ